MNLSADDIVRIHSYFGRADELIEQRRAVYLAALELLGGPAMAIACGPDVIDNPLARGHLGEVIGGTATLSSGRMSSTRDLVTSELGIVAHGLRVASSAQAGARLEPALKRICRELGRFDPSSGLRVLTTADDGYRRAVDRVSDGVSLLVRLLPGLAHDLIQHIALVAVVAHDGPTALGSASAREFPGLVVVPEPGSAIEIAEAVVHEGAHQKFFELAVTRDIFFGVHPEAPLFVPSWSVPGTRWPLEQAVAAFHAYCCLGAMFDAYRNTCDVALHSFSLLPVARLRAREIGGWLLDQGNWLGDDGRAFLAKLADVPSVRVHGPAARRNGLQLIPPSSEDVVVRRVGRRAVVARRANPIELFWVSSEKI